MSRMCTGRLSPCAIYVKASGILHFCEAAPKIEAEFEIFGAEVVVATGDTNLKSHHRLIDFPKLGTCI